MNSDFEDGILEDNSLGALSDVWDEELNDDLLRSDEEDLTTSGVVSHLGCEEEVGAPHHAEDPRRCTGEQQQQQQPGEKPDHGEVFDIPINDPDEFQELTREPVRPQQQKQQQEEEDEEEREEEENSRDEEGSCILQDSAADLVIHSSGLCEEARPAFWGRLNKHEGLARERSGTQMDTQFYPYNGVPDQKAEREFCLQSDAVCSKISVSSLPPLLMELQSTGASPQQVPLTSTQSPANPAVGPSSLQVVADSSRPLHVQTIPAGSHPVFPGQHMFGQQHPTSELDGSPLLHDPVSTGAAGRPGCSGDPRGPLCSPQRNLGLPSLNSSHPAPLCVPGGASLQPVPSVIAQPQPCDTQPFHPDQALSLPQTPPVLHPNPEQQSQSSVSPVQAPPSAWLNSASVKSQSSPLSQPASICCAVIKPRMVQISPNVSRVLSDRPVLAHNSSFINVARPTPTPAAQVRPIARAVATGMPGAARQQASARAGVCARAAPEPVLAGKSRGQEVKEEPQSPLSSLSKEEREKEEEEEVIEDDKDSLGQSQTGNDSKDGVPAWYRLQLEKQKHLRRKLIGQKEKRRQLQADYRRKQRQDKLKNALQNHDKKPQDGRQAQNIKNPSQKPPASNILPLLRPPPKPGYPPAAPLAHCPTAAPAALVERAALRHGNPFPWHGFHGRAEERSGGFSGVLGERHGRRKRRRKWMARKRVMTELPSKVRMVKRSNMEEDEDGMNTRFPVQVSEGSRVVTFTQIPCFGPHTLRQVCPNLRR